MVRCGVSELMEVAVPQSSYLAKSGKALRQIGGINRGAQRRGENETLVTPRRSGEPCSRLTLPVLSESGHRWLRDILSTPGILGLGGAEHEACLSSVGS